jgi:hypothetical protein
MNEPKKLGFIDWMDSTRMISRAIALPDELYSRDGRVFRVHSWHPEVDREAVVTVKLTAVVLMDKSIEEHTND